jgi:hypothetical protein
MSPELLDVALTGLNVDRELREAIIGDMIEEHAEIAATRGNRLANWWIVSQLLRSAPILARATLREDGEDGWVRAMLRTVGAAVLALGIVLVAASLSASVAFAALAPETLARLTMVMLAIDLGYGVAGGYLAARLGRAPLTSAAIFGVLGATMSIFAAGTSPSWYAMALSLFLLPATVAGGWIRARQIVRSARPR